MVFASASFVCATKLSASSVPSFFQKLHCKNDARRQLDAGKKRKEKMKQATAVLRNRRGRQIRGENGGRDGRKARPRRAVEIRAVAGRGKCTWILGHSRSVDSLAPSYPHGPLSVPDLCTLPETAASSLFLIIKSRPQTQVSRQRWHRCCRAPPARQARSQGSQLRAMPGEQAQV